MDTEALARRVVLALTVSEPDEWFGLPVLVLQALPDRKQRERDQQNWLKRRRSFIDNMSSYGASFKAGVELVQEMIEQTVTGAEGETQNDG